MRDRIDDKRFHLWKSEKHKWSNQIWNQIQNPTPVLPRTEQFKTTSGSEDNHQGSKACWDIRAKINKNKDKKTKRNSKTLKSCIPTQTNCWGERWERWGNHAIPDYTTYDVNLFKNNARGIAVYIHQSISHRDTEIDHVAQFEKNLSSAVFTVVQASRNVQRKTLTSLMKSFSENQEYTHNIYLTSYKHSVARRVKMLL